MGYGYSSFRGWRGCNQSMSEKIARSQLAAVNQRQSRFAENKASNDELRRMRQEELKKFKEGDRVTNGKFNAKVSRFDHKNSLLVVVIDCLGKEEVWTPETTTRLGLTKV